MRRTLRIICGLIALACAAPGNAQERGRLIDAADVNAADNHIDIVVQFGCGFRYLGHDPASNGKQVRVRLAPMPDCGFAGAGIVAPERAAVADPTIVTAITMEQLFAQEFVLQVELKKPEQFVLAPSADQHGIRIRLLRPQSQTRVFINDAADAPTYSVNLDSAQAAFKPEDLQAVQTLTHLQPYVSELLVEGQRWYRLRVGPFASRAQAENMLALARSKYPRAWLAIADETNAAEPVAENAVPPTRTKSSAPILTDADRNATMKAGRDALRAKQYGIAIGQFTKLVEQPEYPQRADALELLGLARERNRQLAHAKAEYEEFVRLYPQASQIGRVRERLRALVWASRRGSGFGTDNEGSRSAWRVYGGTGVRYEYDDNKIETTRQNVSFTAQNGALLDGDVVARRAGTRFDFLSRGSGSMQHDMLKNGPGDRTRVGALFAEVSDRDWHWSARLGRQSRSGNGVLGLYDGVYLAYQAMPRLRIATTYGYPVDTSYDGFNTERTLMGVSADLGTFAQSIDASVYVIQQDNAGFVERRALGMEVRYFRPGRSLVGLVDYDFEFSEVNSIVLLGVWELPSSWSLNFNVDRRNSPLLTTRNALIGQTVETLDQLGGLFSDSEIEALARDRTAVTSTYSLGVSRPFGERLRLLMDASSTSIGSTPASGGVTAMPTSGNLMAYSLQLTGGDWWTSRDFNILGFRYQSGADASIASAAYYFRVPVGTAWRIGPRVRADYQRFDTDDSTRTMYVPSLRLDYLGRKMFFMLEGGYEFGTRDLQTETQDTTRYYLSAEWRWNF